MNIVVCLIALLVVVAAGVTPQQQLPIYYRFEPNNLTADSCGTHHVGEVVGNAPTLIDGGGVFLNSSSDWSFIRFDDDPAFNLETGDWSLSVWVMIGVNYTNHSRIIAHGSHETYDGWSFMLWNAWGSNTKSSVPVGGIVFLFSAFHGEWIIGTCHPMNDGKWHHYAVRWHRSAGNVAFFLDGAQLTSPCDGFQSTAGWGNTSYAVGDITNLGSKDIRDNCSMCIGGSCNWGEKCIGKDVGDIWEPLEGALDELIFYKYALPDEDIAQHAVNTARTLLPQVCHISCGAANCVSCNSVGSRCIQCAPGYGIDLIGTCTECSGNTTWSNGTTTCQTCETIKGHCVGCLAATGVCNQWTGTTQQVELTINTTTANLTQLINDLATQLGISVSLIQVVVIDSNTVVVTIPTSVVTKLTDLVTNDKISNIISIRVITDTSSASTHQVITSLMVLLVTFLRSSN